MLSLCRQTDGRTTVKQYAPDLSIQGHKKEVQKTHGGYISEIANRWKVKQSLNIVTVNRMKHFCRPKGIKLLSTDGKTDRQTPQNLVTLGFMAWCREISKVSLIYVKVKLVTPGLGPNLTPEL